jgi:hypothetical protein
LLKTLPYGAHVPVDRVPADTELLRDFVHGEAAGQQLTDLLRKGRQIGDRALNVERFVVRRADIDEWLFVAGCCRNATPVASLASMEVLQLAIHESRHSRPFRSTASRFVVTEPAKCDGDALDDFVKVRTSKSTPSGATGNQSDLPRLKTACKWVLLHTEGFRVDVSATEAASVIGHIVGAKARTWECSETLGHLSPMSYLAAEQQG